MYTMILLPRYHFSQLPILLFLIALLFFSIFHLSLELNLFVQSIALLFLRFLILSAVLPFSFCTFFDFSFEFRLFSPLNSSTLLESRKALSTFQTVTFFHPPSIFLISSVFLFFFFSFPLHSLTLVVLSFFDIRYVGLSLHLIRSKSLLLLLPIPSRLHLALAPFLV